MEREQIQPPDGQSFRLFSWKGDIEKVRLHRANGTTRRKKGLGNRWHYHRECELTVITEGKGTRFIGDDAAQLRPPDLVLLGPNLPHFWSSRSSSGYCAQFTFGTSFDTTRLEELNTVSSLIGRAGKGLAFSPGTTTQVAELLGQAEQQSAIRRLATLLEIFDLLIEDGGAEISSIKPAPGHGSIGEAVRYIVENAGDRQLSLQNLLEHIGASKSTFSRQFRNETGQTYSEFVLDVRLEKVRHLLLSTDLNIAEIAYDSGFGCLSSFNQAFRQKWGVSPRDYRQHEDDASTTE